MNTQRIDLAAMDSVGKGFSIDEKGTNGMQESALRCMIFTSAASAILFSAGVCLNDGVKFFRFDGHAFVFFIIYALACYATSMVVCTGLSALIFACSIVFSDEIPS